MAGSGVRLVYGGGKTGLMGAVAFGAGDLAAAKARRLSAANSTCSSQAK